jgi:phosphate transport system permease protein
MPFPFPQASPRFWNRVARVVITWGGGLLILAALAILLFIAREALPLARHARASDRSAAAPASGAAALLAGTDEHRELGFEVLPRETVFFRLAGGETLLRIPHPFGDGVDATSVAYNPQQGSLALGAADGRAALGSIDFDVAWQGGKRSITPRLRWRGTALLDSGGGRIVHVAADRNEDGEMVLVGITDAGRLEFARVDAEGAADPTRDLTARLESRHPTSLVLALRASLLAVGAQDGTLYLWKLDDLRIPELEDHVQVAAAEISALGVLAGDQSIVVGTGSGEVSVWFRVRYMRAVNHGTTTVSLRGQTLGPGEERVVLDQDYGRTLGHVPGLQFTNAGQPWTRVRTFKPRPGTVMAIAPSPRSRDFAAADDRGIVRLYHSTSARELLDLKIAAPSAPRSLGFTPKADGLVALGADGSLHTWSLDSPHPEASIPALFGRVWYEGYVEPRHVWQSTGGSDDFEPKLNLVPLLFGTLKGTLYAMLFSVPVALLAALYLSQLASPAVRNVVKPVIELMAAMPSVVVGFLGALWLAPILEAHLAGAASALVVLPLGFVAALGTWYLLPRSWRQGARPGLELAFLVPFLVAAVWVGSVLGGPAERLFFAGNLHQWLYDHQGIRYDQRNCIVVGIALGFAVIPVIFTICEDALTAVPPSLTSAALALGASRWQSALHVVLPAASPGIFAAIMLGLGRAIGETMIVLMATGNTPILDLSPFNGMRTMSAAIAVEIPEAPHGGTLYRVLFLTGALLFVFTFVLNTGADVVGRRLRKRYGQF